jgi:tetratricopeptide (TPR) repeat protein
MIPGLRFEHKPFPALRRTQLYCWFLSLWSCLFCGVCSAQVTGFPSDQHLTNSTAQAKSPEQLIADLALARQTLASHPSGEANLSLGLALRALGETEPASKRFASAVELNPKLSQAWFEQGLIASELGDWSRAADLFRQALAASPNLPSAHLALGEMLLRAGDFENSATQLKTALRLDPSSSGVHQGLGLIYLQEGKIDAAGDEFRRALAIRRDYRDAEKGLARTLADQHRWAEAATLLREIIAANPNSVEEISCLGTTLANLGDKTGAEAEFARARELSGRELMTLRVKGDLNWGVALRKEGKWQEAVAAFRRALGEDPRDCEAHDDLGEVLWMQRDADKALSEFRYAVGCNPSSASARNNLGSALLYDKHEIEGAIDQFRSALAVRPGFALAHFNLGKALAAEQEFAGAEREFRSAIAIDPTLAAAHVNLGMVLAMNKGSVSVEAQAEMKNGVRLDPRLRDVIPSRYLAYLQ